MDNLKQYVQNARQRNMADEDIIMELSKVGWSIPDIHKALYKPSSPSPNEMFQRNPILMQHSANLARQNQLQTTNPSQTQLSPAQQTQSTYKQTLANAALQRANGATAVAPEEAPVPTKKPRSVKKVVLFVVAGVFIFALGAGAGLGGGYWYLKRQLAAFGGGSFGVGDNSMYESGLTEGLDEAEESTGSTEEASEDNNEKDAGKQSSSDGSSSGSSSGGDSSSSSGSSGGSSNNSSSGSSGSSSSCKSSTSTPSRVCAAIYSIVDDFSPSNPYLSNYEGQFPSGADLLSADEKTWLKFASDQGRIVGSANIPPLGQVPVEILFKTINGKWEITTVRL